MDEHTEPFPWPGVTPVQPAPPPGAGATVRARRWPKVAAALGIAGGTAMGAAVLAAAATSGDSPPNASTTATSGTDGSSGTNGPSSSGSSGSSGLPERHMDGPGGFGGPGGPFGGRVLHGEFTVQGPNGYETLQEQTGTVTDVSNTSGNTWSLTVKSADGTSLTYVVDSGTSIDGGELGISSVSKNDTVHVLAVVSNGTATAKDVADQTVMQSNGQSWMPTPPGAGSNSSSGSSSSGTTTS